MKTHLILLLATGTLALAQTTDIQTWTASDGRVIQVKFIKLDGEAVVIEKDGQQYIMPFARPNAESVAHARRWVTAHLSAAPSRS